MRLSRQVTTICILLLYGAHNNLITKANGSSGEQYLETLYTIEVLFYTCSFFSCRAILSPIKTTANCFAVDIKLPGQISHEEDLPVVFK